MSDPRYNPLSRRGLAYLVLTCLAMFPILLPAQSERDTHKLVVDYTGRLFGYYRMEPPPGDQTVLAPVSNFLEKRENLDWTSDSKTKPLLLGMGDNFAPEFGASIQQELGKASIQQELEKQGHDPEEQPCFLPTPSPQDPTNYKSWSKLAPEILYKAETRKPRRADCDNVARFLMAAGYSAITPGREDFLYSGTWLRRIAYLLRGASGDFDTPSKPRPNSIPQSDGAWSISKSNSVDHTLHMLAANLRVKVTAPKTPSKADFCPLLFSEDLASEVECSAGDESVSAAMGWLSRVDSALDPVIRQSLYRQSATYNRFSQQLLANELAVFASILKESPDAKIFSLDIKSKLATNLKEVTQKLGAAGKAQTDDEYTSAFINGASGIQTLIQALEGSSGQATPTALAAEKDLLTVSLELSNRIDTVRTKSPLLSKEGLQATRNLLLREIASEQRNIGYTVIQSPSKESKTLIIGVVGKETMQEVSKDSFAVYPDLFDCQTTDPSQKEKGSDERQKGPACTLWHKVYGEDLKKAPPDPQDEKVFDNKDAFSITPGDPLEAAEMVLRAAWLQEGPIDHVVLMAQMPASEAEEVGAHLRAHLHDLYKDERAEEPLVDLILSEAQAEHATGNETLDADPRQTIPVFSPYLAYERLNAADPYPVSRATIIRHSRLHTDRGTVVWAVMHNRPKFAFREEPTSPLEETDSGCQKPSQVIPNGKDLPNGNKPWTAACLLERELETARPITQQGSLADTDLTRLWGNCTTVDEAKQLRASQACQNAVLMRYLLHELQSHYDTDLAVLKRRDFWFGALKADYDGYEMCRNWVQTHFQPSANSQDIRNGDFPLKYCKLRVALDRVLWRGDYSARALVDGTTLTAMIKTAQQETNVETTLLPNDLHDEWLTTFGITSSPATNLVVASAGPESFSLPGMVGCKAPVDPPLGKPDPSSKPPSPYCVDGFTIATDAAYWIATSGQLVQDKVTYKDLSSFVAKDSRHFIAGAGNFSGETYLTTAIAEQIFRKTQGSSTIAESAVSESGLARLETQQQNQRLMQVDISKFVAGYSFTAPNINDTSLGNDLSGVSNTQATTPHSSEMDFEFLGRTVSLPIANLLAFGIQNDFEFDHKRTGNTQGKPATVVYQINSETVGGFMQFHLPVRWFIHNLPPSGIKSARNLPRAFLVFAPYQYQRQVVGTPLYFGFLTPPYTNNPSQQLTVTIPISDGFNWRTGFRYEAGGGKPWFPDVGSYVELGPEYSVQGHILSGVDMPDLAGLTPPAGTTVSTHCDVVANQPIYNCIKSAYKAVNATLNQSSHIVPDSLTLHTGGLYWISHTQKILDKKKKTSISFDTTGDSFLLPGHTLPTQTRYAINNKLAFNFNVLGNWMVSPTYSVFNFENQGASRTPVNTTSFSMSLKWYYSRDTEVPFNRVLWFSGPKSADQTSSSKIK